RSSLASGTILTCAWAGRPGWQIHHMAMGETIGFSGRATINNVQYTGSPLGNRGAHVSLLGDPSLTLLPVIPPTGLKVTEVGSNINLQWAASPEATEGYMIFRRKTSEVGFKKVAENIKVLTYSESCLDKDVEYEYLVAAVKLEANASGTYFNRSAGTRASIIPKNSSRTKADFTAIQDYEFLSAKSISTNTNKNFWFVNGQNIIGDTIKITFPCSPSMKTISLASEGLCNTDTIVKIINITCSKPSVLNYSNGPLIKCFGDVTDVKLDSVTGAGPFTYLWSNGSTQNSAKNVSGKISVIITSSKNTKDTFKINLPEFTQVQITNIQVKNVNPGFNKGSITNVVSQGGVPPYTYKILNVSRQDSLDAGIYTLEVTDANGCKTTKTFEIKINTAVHNLSAESLFLYPNPCKEEIFIKSELIIDRIRIYNLDGKDLGTINSKANSSDLYRIDIHSLSSGIYYLELNMKDIKSRLSFVKE
ncbi:MAG: T9SS type A sorting domain-containing protein, partial [Saprospiraceae bacterium]